MRTSAISLVTGTDRRRKQTLSEVLSCKLPSDMWLLPDNPSSQHIHVCVCTPSRTMVALFSFPWQQAMMSPRRTCRTEVTVKLTHYTTKGFFWGVGGCFVFLFAFVIKEGEAWSKTSICQSVEDCCFSNEQFGDQIVWRGVTPLLRFPTKPQLSILWSPLGNHCTEQWFEFLDLCLIFRILLLICYQHCYYFLLNL